MSKSTIFTKERGAGRHLEKLGDAGGCRRGQHDNRFPASEPYEAALQGRSAQDGGRSAARLAVTQSGVTTPTGLLTASWRLERLRRGGDAARWRCRSP